jgi:hypothetical protein
MIRDASVESDQDEASMVDLEEKRPWSPLRGESVPPRPRPQVLKSRFGRAVLG